MDRMRASSHLAGPNAAYIEELYEAYLDSPNSVSEVWRSYFDTLPIVDGAVGPDTPHTTVIEHFERLGKNKHKARPEQVATHISNAHELKQMHVQDLIEAYRRRGHTKADIDPLKMMNRPGSSMLELSYHSLNSADLDETFNTGTLNYGAETATLRDIQSALEATYCSKIGAEYMHIVDPAELLWVQQRLESARSKPNFDADQKIAVLERLIAAEGLEKYLHRKYPGLKRFGLEGAESLIPLFHELLQRLGGYGVRESVIGMAHRGRLNVLVNTMGKSPSDLYDEFDGNVKISSGSGDVKYHQGYSSSVMTRGGEMHLALNFNPSHLEIVGPVVQGSVRARQDRRGDETGDLVCPIVVHGDAAFAGQGVVMETFQMSQTVGFKTGGTVHIIINNQVGFTTDRQEDARSTEYCTEVAKMVQAPIFHVNGDDPEAVVFVTQLAADYRMAFHKDVVIELVCYRRRGHNEGEEPMKTQPMMYQKIRSHPSVCESFGKTLLEDGCIEEERLKDMTDSYRSRIERGKGVALSLVHEPNSELFVDWRPYLGHDWDEPGDTRFDKKEFQTVADKLGDIPNGFVLHRQVEKIVDDRHRMAAGAKPSNWGMGEVMAYATLLSEGHAVRLTGQDVGVGTFSHRHAIFHNQKDGSRVIPLKSINEQARFDVFDSLLSEEAVLAFEYGYSATAPNSLVIWEAQFGDFANGAQVVVDQFISSGETKWARLSGLTLLLPHGYEGQGPEHSSARLERYLQMCAEHNMQICIPSTPAQVFHMLRRQAIRPTRIPLIALTPKSLLRHNLAVSSLEEMCDGAFETVIGEVDDLNKKSLQRLILCSGKVYYDLLEARREAGLENVGIIRIEQLYPFPTEKFVEKLKEYQSVEKVIWCQEEPMNQGAWYPFQHRLRAGLDLVFGEIELDYAGREAFAAPAGGSPGLHLEQQQQLLKDALYS